MPAWAKLAAEEIDGAIREGVVLLDFFSETCPPCHALEPRLEAFARRHRDELRIFQIDIEENDETARGFGVMSIPTLIFFCDGREVERLDGLILDDDLERALRAAT